MSWWRALPALTLDLAVGLICGYAALWGDDLIMRALGVLGCGCVGWWLGAEYERARIETRLGRAIEEG